MPQPRRPLGVISSNISKKPLLTPYLRGKIAYAAELGYSPAQIAIQFDKPDSTIRNTLKVDHLRNNGNTRTRTGRPREYTDREVRILVKHVRNNPKDTWAEVKRATGLKYHKTTLLRMLEPSGIKNWRCRRRPHLTAAAVAKRLAWCKAREHFTLEDWRKYMWSDECSAERGKGGAQEWCFRTASCDKWAPAMVTTYKKARDISVMVWACFWFVAGKICRSDLYIMDRDFESKKHGYSAKSYLEVLEDQMPRCWQPGLIFMQDNASIHKSHTVMNWFREMGIPLVDWPPYSPDLNPIEHIWWHLKSLVLKNHPEIELIGVGEEAKEALEKALIEAWNDLPSSLFEQYVDSIPYQVKACIDAKG